MKMLCVKDKHGNDVELICVNIESLEADNGTDTTIRMISGQVYEVAESIQHIKRRIEHQTSAIDA